MTYQDFIQSKRHSAQDHGIAPWWLPNAMFPFQRHVAEADVRFDKSKPKTLFDEFETVENYEI